MTILKEQHETFAQFFTAPTREALRELLRRNIGETDYLDFKADWPALPKLARHILALANSGGGALVVGVSQQTDGSLVPSGLPSIKDKAELIPPSTAGKFQAICRWLFVRPGVFTGERLLPKCSGYSFGENGHAFVL